MEKYFCRKQLRELDHHRLERTIDSRWRQARPACVILTKGMLGHAGVKTV